MNSKEIILVSSSPRRISILRKLGIPFKALPPKHKEKIFETPEKTVLTNAKAKIESVLHEIQSSAILISADTVVVIDNKILGKPRNKSEALEFLKMLSGRTHEVYTALVIYDTEKKLWDWEVIRSLVKFVELTDDEIKDYIATGEPFDKAGGYGIQGIASFFIEEIHGDFFAIVGFPLHTLYRLLKKHGINLLKLIRGAKNAGNNTASELTEKN